VSGMYVYVCSFIYRHRTLKRANVKYHINQVVGIMILIQTHAYASHANAHGVQSTEHQTLHFGHSNALITRALALISNRDILFTVQQNRDITFWVTFNIDEMRC
jgi:hypothetical protein